MVQSPTAAAPLAGLAPNVIGATGGSGTRVVGKIVRRAGMYIGTNLNDYEDALDLAGYSDRWINDFVPTGLGGLEAATRRAMLEDLVAVLERHRADLPAGAPAWGWKEPRSIYLLPFFNSVMPELRFLHWIRDGRDMAFSENQQQLKKHSSAVLTPEENDQATPLRSIVLWSRANTWAADFGERQMSGRYLRLRFEDLCAEPVETVARIYRFFGIDGDGEQAATEVRAPKSLGRWRRGRRKTVGKLHELGRPALERFGYLEPA